MTNYVIAIPSYKRHNELSNKTLTLLKKYNINPDNIFIFVANKTERKLYEENLDENLYNEIVVGKKGITKQRIFISKYFPEKQYIVSLDDDIEKVFELKNKKLVELKDLDLFFKNAYKELIKKNLFLWGVYPTPNEFFMYNRMTTDMRFIIGVMHGYINRHDKSLYPSTTLQSKEDYHQTILFYLKDGGVIRHNNITFKTKFNAPGGLGKDRFDKNQKAANFLAKKYPKIVTKKRRKNGTAEIILNKTIKKR